MPGVNKSMTYLQNVQRGAYPGSTCEHKFGYAPAVGTAEVTVWAAPTAALVAYPAAPITAFLSSSSTDDDVAGTGALTVKIWYYKLSTSTELSTATLTLLGQLSDGVGISLWRIHRMKVLSSGSGNKNAGDIWLGSGAITTGVPAVKYGVIAIGDNITQQSFMWVPTGKTAEIHSLKLSVNIGKDGKIAIFHREFGADEFYRGDTYETAAILQSIPLDPPDLFLAGSDIELRVKAAATTSFIGANFDVVLRDTLDTDAANVV